jgi:hypothetical protein
MLIQVFVFLAFIKEGGVRIWLIQSSVSSTDRSVYSAIKWCARIAEPCHVIYVVKLSLDTNILTKTHIMSARVQSHLPNAYFGIKI